MEQLVAEVLQLDHQRQAVFQVALAHHVQPVLAASKHYDYAVRAVDLCWSWIEHRDVDGMTMYYLVQDDDDHGVATAMYASHDHDLVMWNAWGCVAEALTYTGFCAFEATDTPPPEIFENAFPDESVAEFLGYYHAVVGQDNVPESLAVFLRDAPDSQLTRPVVSAKVEEFASAQPQ